ncbi:MAG: TatD family hydrolase [Victivallales bacterium]|nr:TatD family hydrolase [Victivallales bacterium]
MYIDAHSHQPSPGPEITTLWSVSPHAFPAIIPPHTLIAAGVHPWDTGDVAAADAALARLETLAATNKLAAIGECGLDRLRGAPLPQQTEILRRQLILAERYHLPVVTHDVRAFPELLALRRIYRRTPWLIHGFGGNTAIAAQLLAKDCLLSFGVAVLRRPRIMAWIKELPPAAWLLETDASGQDIVAIYHALAAGLNIDLELLQQRQLDNFQHFLAPVPPP